MKKKTVTNKMTYKRKIINWKTKAIIIEGENLSVKKMVEKAIKNGVSLEYANLRRANLEDANLEDANLEDAI